MSTPVEADEAWLVLVLHLALLIGVWACWLCLDQVRELRGLRRVLLALVLAVSALALGVFGPGDVPNAWLTPLQEGGSADHVLQLTGLGAHAGFGFEVVRATFIDLAAPLRGHHAVTWMNLWLSSIDALLFFGIAQHVLRRTWGAVVMTIVFSANRFAVNGALSETPGPYVTLLLLLGVLGIAVAAHPAHGRERSWGVAVVALSTILAGLARLETAGYGILTLPPLLFALREPERARRLDDWLGMMAARVRARPKRAILGGLALAVALQLGSSLIRADGDAELAWLLRGVSLRPSYLLQMPGFVASGWLPLPVFVLAVIGAAHTLRRWRELGGFALAVFMLLGIYLAASHDERNEHLRYGTTVAPALCLLALFGLRWLAERVEQRARQRALVAGALVAITGVFLILDIVRGDSYVVSRNQQREVRSLAGLLDAHPRCAIATPVNANWSEPDRPFRWSIVLFANDSRAPMQFYEPGAHWQRALARYLDPYPCVLLYRGVDCSLIAGDCGAWGPSEPVVWRWSYEDRPYTTHMGKHRDPIELSAVRLR